MHQQLYVLFQSRFPEINGVCRRIHVFMDNALEIGFFLNLERFGHAVYNHPRQGGNLGALQSAAYLWSVHLSPSPEIRARESQFLLRALDSVAQGLSSGCTVGPFCLLWDYAVADG
jgi:hypothetical protein